MKRTLVAAGVVLAVAGAALCVVRIASLESHELEIVRDVRPVGTRTELARVRLDAGETAVFEACSRDGFPPEHWRGAARLVVRHVDSGEVVVDAALDSRVLSRARRGPQGACIVVASGKLEIAGQYALEVVDARTGLPELRAHIVAFRDERGSGDVWRLALLLGGVLLTLLASIRWRKDDGPAEREARGAGAIAAQRVGAGAGALAAAIVALALVPLWGSTAGFVRGVVLAVVQVLAAVLLLRREPGTLAARRPERIVGWALLALAPVAGVALWIAGTMIARMIPSTGVAPIETFVSWPSGNLAVAAIAVAVPVAEELFFRGLIYGSTERAFGAPAAFAVSVILFALAHLPQQWGNWGAFASVVLTGVVLTALRALSRTVVVPAVAHVAHNAILALGALA